MTRARLQRFSLLIIALFQCFRCSYSLSETTPLDNKAIGGIYGFGRRWRSTKTSKSSKGSKGGSSSSTSSEDERDSLTAPVAYSPVAWSPAMSPAEWSDLYYYGGNAPTSTPENVFDHSETDSSDTDEQSEDDEVSLQDEKDSPGTDEQHDDEKDSPGTDEQNEDAKDSPSTDEQNEGDEDSYPSLGEPQHIVVKVSVAMARSTSPSGIREAVAKVTTNVIRSYTQYVVYMSDASRTRRVLQATRLEHDPNVSSISLAAHGADESWWTYNVAYKVTTGAEEVRDVDEIEAVAKSAVDGAILTGLFQQLLSQLTSEVLGVAIPGREMDQPVFDDPKKPPNEGNTAQPSQDNDQRRRGVGIGIAILCFAIILCIVAIFFVAYQRRRRTAERSLAIPLGEQRETGRILKAEWEASVRSVYSGASGTNEDKGAFSLYPQDPPGSFMLDSWDQGTHDGTADVTDEITAWSYDDSASLSGSLIGSLT